MLKRRRSGTLQVSEVLQVLDSGGVFRCEKDKETRSSRGRRPRLQSNALDALDVNSGTFVDVSDSLSNAAIGKGRLVAIVRMFPADHPDPFQLFECHGESSKTDQDGILSALRWFDDDRLIVGFRSGAIHVYDANTLRLLFRRTFHPNRSPVRRIKKIPRTILARPAPGGLAATPFLEMWYLHEDGVVIAHSFEALETSIAVGNDSREKRSRRDCTSVRDARRLDIEATPFEHFAWTFSGQKTVDDFCVVVPTRASLFDAHPPGNIAHIVVFGSGAPVASYVCQRKNETRSKSGVVKELASAVVGKLSSTVLKWGLMTKSDLAELVGGGSGSAGALDGDESRGRAKRIRPTRLAVYRSIRDPSRRVESVSMDPSGTVCVTTDNLGRVLLLDAETLRVLRMWKGYRDAQCGWMHYHQRSDYESKLPSASSPSWYQTATDGLYVVLYTANRRVLEIWRARCGPRVDAVAVPGGCRLFTLPFPVIENMDDQSVARSYRARCMLLRPTSVSKRDGAEKDDGSVENHPTTKSKRKGGNWELLEVVLSESAKAVVRRHFRQNVDQRESRALSRMMSVVASLKVVSESDADRDREVRFESAISFARAIRTPALQSRAAEALEDAAHFAHLHDLYRKILGVFLRSDSDGVGEEERKDASQLKRSFRWRLRLLSVWSYLEKEQKRSIPSAASPKLAVAKSSQRDRGAKTASAFFLDEVLLWAKSARPQSRVEVRSESDVMSFLQFRRETEALRDTTEETGVEDTSSSKTARRPHCSYAVGSYLFGPVLMHASSSNVVSRSSRLVASFEEIGISRRTLCCLFSNFLCRSELSNIDRTGVRYALQWLRDVVGTQKDTAFRLSHAMRETCLDVDTPQYDGVLLQAALCVSTLHFVEGELSEDFATEIDEWERIRRAARAGLFVSLCILWKDGAPSTVPDGHFDVFLSSDPAKLRALVATNQLQRSRDCPTTTPSPSPSGRRKRRGSRTITRGRSSSVDESVVAATFEQEKGGDDDDKKNTTSDGDSKSSTTETVRPVAAAENDTMSGNTSSPATRHEEGELVSQCTHLVALAIDSSRDPWSRLSRGRSYASRVAPLVAKLTEDTLTVHRIHILSSKWRDLNSRSSGSATCSFAKLELLRQAVKELDSLHARSALSGPSSRALWNDVLKPVVDNMRLEGIEEKNDTTMGKKKRTFGAKRGHGGAGKIIRDSHRVQFLALCQRALEMLTDSVAATSTGRATMTRPETGTLCLSQHDAYVDATKSENYDTVSDFVAMRLARLYYEAGDDIQGVAQIERVQGDTSKFALANVLLPLAQQRLASIFRMCESSALHAPVLACVDADICCRLLQESAIDNAGRPTAPFTLAMTEALLKRVEILFAESPSKDDAAASMRADAIGWIARLRKAACEALSAARERRLIVDFGGKGPRSLAPLTPSKARGKSGRKRGASSGSGGDWV